MKQFLTLIIALLTFVTGSQVVHAEATDVLDGTIKTGMVLSDPSDINYQAFLFLWYYFKDYNHMKGDFP